MSNPDTRDPVRETVRGLREGLAVYDAAIVSALATLREKLADRASAIAALKAVERDLPDDHLEPIRPVAGIIAAESTAYYNALPHSGAHSIKQAGRIPIEFCVPLGAER